MRKFICGFLMLISLVSCMGLTSCKAQRIISSSATYTQVTDSTKLTTTIQSKTVEEYTGVKKH